MELVPSKPRVEQRRRLFTRYVFLFLGFGSRRPGGWYVLLASRQAGGRAGGRAGGQDRVRAGQGIWANLPLARRQRTGEAWFGFAAWLGLHLECALWRHSFLDVTVVTVSVAMGGRVAAAGEIKHHDSLVSGACLNVVFG